MPVASNTGDVNICVACSVDDCIPPIGKYVLSGERVVANAMVEGGEGGPQVRMNK